MRPISENQKRYTEGLCFQPMAQVFDFSTTQGEKDVVKAYKAQLGKTKHHKFETVFKFS